VSKQFAQRVSLIEILLVTEIRALPARHVPRTCLVAFGIGHRRRRQFGLGGALAIFVDGDGGAVGAADFGGGIANSHGRKGWNTLKRLKSRGAWKKLEYVSIITIIKVVAFVIPEKGV